MTSYGLARDVVDTVLPNFVIDRGDAGKVYDYWSATEEACFRLNVESASSAGNEIDGIIVSAVEDRYGALPDSRLTPIVAP